MIVSILMKVVPQRYEPETSDGDRYCNMNRYDRGVRYNNNPPPMLSVLGFMYLVSGAFLVLSICFFLTWLAAFGVMSMILGIGYLKGYTWSWYMGVIMSVVLALVALSVALTGYQLWIFGIFFTIAGVAGVICNILPLVYLLTADVRYFFFGNGADPLRGRN